MNLIERIMPIQGKRVLDIGCGIGTFVKRFRQKTDRVVGIDVEHERVRRGSSELPNLLVAVGERLPFRTESFDLVLLNEVIEHVQNDAQVIAEAVRVLAPQGVVIVFAPNRLYPLETHGVQLGGRFIYKLAPFVNWTPNFIRNRLVPHARAYLAKDIARLFAGLPVELVASTYVYPGYDKIAARSPRLGAALRKVTYALEATPLRRFGLSHFIAARKCGTKQRELSELRSDYSK